MVTPVTAFVLAAANTDGFDVQGPNGFLVSNNFQLTGTTVEGGGLLDGNNTNSAGIFDTAVLDGTMDLFSGNAFGVTLEGDPSGPGTGKGVLNVFSPGQAFNVSVGEDAVVNDLGLVNNVTVDSFGGVLNVGNATTAGTANGVTVTSGGVVNVTGTGSTANGTTIGSGGTENLLTATRSTSDLVEAGGQLNVGSVAVAANSNSNQVQGGLLNVVQGTDTGSTVDDNGAIVVEAGASVSGEILGSGGSLFDVGSASGTQVGSNANFFVENGGNATGSVVQTGGTETVNAGGTEASATISGGTLVDQTGGHVTKVTFHDPSATVGGTFAVQGTASPGTIISSFGPNDVIDLQNVSPTGLGPATLGTGNLLSITGTGLQLQLDPTQSYAGDLFTLSPDATGTGTDVKLVQASSHPSEAITLTQPELNFINEVNNLGFKSAVSVIEQTPGAFRASVQAEAKDPLLLASVNDSQANRSGDIANAALQLAKAIQDAGAGNSEQIAATIVAGAVHEIQTGSLQTGFIANHLATRAASLFHSEVADRPF